MSEEKRDGEIKRARQAGETLKQIAIRHGLSPERIRQICGEAHSPSYHGKFMPNAEAHASATKEPIA
jgi:hypothetical protein